MLLDRIQSWFKISMLLAVIVAYHWFTNGMHVKDGLVLVGAVIGGGVAIAVAYVVFINVFSAIFGRFAVPVFTVAGIGLIVFMMSTFASMFTV